MRLCALATLAGALLFSSASALGAPLKIKPPKDELGHKAASIAPDKSLAGDITRKKTSKIQEQPVLKYDQFRIQVELEVASKRHEQIETLQKIIALGSDDTEMPKLLFRLAELYWEESKYYFFEANRTDDKIFAAKDRHDAAAVQQLTEQKAALVKRSNKFQAEAINRYKEIISHYPKFPRMDEVLYFLGHNLWDSNKNQEALGIYKALITRYPKSKYIADAWLAFGEYYFNNSGGKKDVLSKALASYQHAANYPDNAVYGFALYKEAWCYYNLGDFAKALDLFKTVIFYGQLASATTNDNKTALVNQARKDYVLTYSRFGDPLGAEEDFKKIGGDSGWLKMFKGLAGLYYDDGKDKEAVLCYRRLIQLQPLSPDAPVYQARIVDAVMRVGRKQITLEQVRALVKIIDDVKAAGVIKTDADKKAMASAEDLAERTMSNLAVNWHNEAKKTRDDQTFVLANEVYSDYLSIFPNSKKSYVMRFFWAELLNDNLQKYDKAAINYSMVVDIDKKRIANHQKPGKWLQLAAYDAVLAWDQVAKKLPPPQIDKAHPNAKIPLPDAEKRLLQACADYVKYVPKGNEVVEVQYKAAQIYYKYNYFDESSKRFDDICVNHPTHEVAEYACNLVVDTKNLEGDLKGVYDTAKRYLGIAPLMKAHPKLQSDLKTVMEQTAFKLVSQLEGKGFFVGAAKRYEAYVEEFPHGALSDSALFNASVDYFKGHHFDDAIRVRAKLVKEFPTSRFVPDAIYANGEAAESVGDFETAAEDYERYAHAFQKQSGLGGGLKTFEAPKSRRRRHGHRRRVMASRGSAKPSSPQHYDEAKAQAALFNAGVFREGLGQYKAALADRNLYLDMWPNSKDSEAVFLSIANLYEKQGATNKAVQQYLDYEKKYQRDAMKVLDAEAKIAKLYQKVGNKKLAARKRDDIYKYYSHLSSSQKRKVEGAPLDEVAWANLESHEPDFAEYERTKVALHLPPMRQLSVPKLKAALNDFKKQIQEKAKKLQIVQKAYTETVNYKAAGPGICALVKIGDAYAHLENVLKNQNIPAKLPQEVADGIREGLDQQAEPLHQKAAEAYATAVGKSRDLTTYNACSERALGLLSDTFAPDQFPKVTESFEPIKDLPVMKEGVGLLASVQPIPVPDKEEPPPEKIAPPPAVASSPASQPQQNAAENTAQDTPPAPESADDHPPADDSAAGNSAAAQPASSQSNPAASDEPKDDLGN